jgi:hypothetical protein
MPMKYRELRDLARGMSPEVDETWRQPKPNGGSLAIVGRKQDAIFPYVTGRPVDLPDGDDTIIEDEEVQSICREINRLLGRPEDSGC